MGEATERLDITDATENLVWAAAAGRCVLCNRVVTRNDDLGVLVNVGEVAHIVGATSGKRSPRGKSPLTAEERRLPENLLLLCSTCHKPVDEGGKKGYFTIDQLRALKAEHEARIEAVTDVGGDRSTTVLRVIAKVRGTVPDLTYESVLSAALSEGMFPELLPGMYRRELALISNPSRTKVRLPTMKAACG